MLIDNLEKLKIMLIDNLEIVKSPNPGSLTGAQHLETSIFAKT